MAVKTVLVLTIAVCGVIDLAPLTSTQIHPHGFLLGYLLALRWAVLDQRARCPVCLRRLTNPAHIGSRSHIFLEWCGTEFMCPRGHGLLHLPDVAAACAGPRRWTCLDQSWASLFHTGSTR